MADCQNWPKMWRFVRVDTIAGIRDLGNLLVHLIVTLARLAGGLRSVVAEFVLVRHQLLILNRGAGVRRTCVAQIGSSPGCVPCSSARCVCSVPLLF